jgi:hypothetical protein
VLRRSLPLKSIAEILALSVFGANFMHLMLRILKIGFPKDSLNPKAWFNSIPLVFLIGVLLDSPWDDFF